jgi:ParB-like chromosome segregation protein Spo0J
MQKIPINKILIPTEDHYKKEDPILSTKLQSYVKTNGQLKNIVVVKRQDEDYSIIEGRNIYVACVEAGLKEVWCSIIETELHPQIVSMQINELRGETNYLIVSQILNNIGAKIGQLKGVLPYHEQLIRGILSLIEFDWTKTRKKGKRQQGQLFETDSLIKEKEQEEFEAKEAKEEKPKKEKKKTSKPKKKKRHIRREHPCKAKTCPSADKLEQLDDNYSTIYCNECQEIISYER